MDDAEEARAGVSSGRRIVTTALMLAMAVAALEQTVVSTAMPTIIARLKGFDIYPWVFSAYLLAATVTTPIYGKLADLIGRKKVLLFGLGLFGLGSMLSGLARSMPELIAMRVVQGLGAGAVAPIVLTLLGDLYSLKERAKVQGLFSGVWGVSSLAGPALGGVLTDHLSWRWVFFVTVPFGAVSAVILATKVRETVARPEEVAPIDWKGAGLLAAGSTSLLMMVLGETNRPPGWAVLFLALTLILLWRFVRQEQRAADPVLPLDLLAQPTIAASIGGSFLIGALLFGIDTYVPLYVQGVLGGTASRAGRTITPLFLAWSLSVMVAAKVVVRMGFRRTAFIGSALIAAGSAALVVGAQRREWAGPAFPVGLAVIGLGMGPTALSFLLGVQNVVPWHRRGVATGAVVFFRTVGGALGVGVLGAALAFELAHRLAGVSGVEVAAVLRPETHASLTPEQLRAVREALGLTLRDVFLLIFALSLLSMACAARLAGGRAVERGETTPGGEDVLLASAVEP